MKLLIVEDNPDIVANLYEFLEPRGFVLDHARTGQEGLQRARGGRFDAIVLDVMLPGMEGTTLCQRLRRELRQATPVLMLTARDSLDDKLLGFASGADDYLVKPFLMAELEARILALVRRSRGAMESVLTAGDLSFDTATYEVRRGGRSAEQGLADQPRVRARAQLADHPLVGRHHPDVLPGEIGVRQRAQERPWRGAARHRQRGMALAGVGGAQLIGDQLRQVPHQRVPVRVVLARHLDHAAISRQRCPSEPVSL